MAEVPSVRSAYSNLVTVLAKCFPSNCSHLKKLPKSESIVKDWQVLLNNPRVAQRDMELFHAPPLSSLGLSRLYKEGKLTPKSQASIWGYVDLVLEALQPQPIDVPSPADMELMRSVLGGRADFGQDGGINLGNLASLVKGRLHDTPELGQMLGDLLSAKASPESPKQTGPAHPDILKLQQLLGGGGQNLHKLQELFGGGEDQRQRLEALMASFSQANSGSDGNLQAIAEQLQTNPLVQQLMAGLTDQEGNFETIGNIVKNPAIQKLVGGLNDQNGDFETIGKFVKEKVASNGELLSSLLENDANFGDVASGVLDSLPEELKAKFATFAQEVSDQEGDMFANAMSSWSSHFNVADLQGVAAAIIPNLNKLIPKEQAVE
jgi:hypothetical protein